MLYSDYTQRIDGLDVIGMATTGNTVTIVYGRLDGVNNYSGSLSAYKQLDIAGNLVKDGLIGRIDTNATTTQNHNAFNIQASDNKYIIGGKGILGKGLEIFYTADKDMNRIDSGGLGLYFENIPPDESAQEVGRSNGISNMVDTSLQVDFAYRIDSDGYVSVNDAEKQRARNRIEIYPNPATDKVIIDDVFNAAGTYYLYNMEGRLIRSAGYDRYNRTIRLDDYLPGLYLLRVVTAGDENYTFKILHR